MRDTIERFSTGTYTVRRAPPATFVSGRRAIGSSYEIQVVASVQPLTGRELMRLPEGERTRERMVVFTADALHTQSDDHAGDEIIIDGDVWEVERVENWSTLGGYWRSFVVRRER